MTQWLNRMRQNEKNRHKNRPCKRVVRHGHAVPFDVRVLVFPAAVMFFASVFENFTRYTVNAIVYFRENNSPLLTLKFG